MPLNPGRVPEPRQVLLPLAERWGIGDDHDRAATVTGASTTELLAFISAVEAVPDDALYGWLAGPESHSQQPTQEYMAMTCLTMAADSARLTVSRR